MSVFLALGELWSKDKKTYIIYKNNEELEATFNMSTESMTCECGATFQRRSYRRHLRSQRHARFVAELETSDEEVSELDEPEPEPEPEEEPEVDEWEGFDLGDYMRTIRAEQAAREAQSAREQAARDADLERLRREIEQLRREAERLNASHWRSSDPRGVLGLSAGYSQRELKKAYRRLSLVHHPDKGGDAAAFRAINEAYETLRC